MSIKCGSCGAQLSEEFLADPRPPCPTCRSTIRALDGDDGSATIGTVADVSATATQVGYAHTGRQVGLEQVEQHARTWAALPSGAEMLKHSLASEFRQLLGSKAPLAGSGLVLFRGQGMEGEGIAPSMRRMGPVPNDCVAKEGRYHCKGDRALYLADSEEGVRREMEAWHTVGTAYVIRVDIPLTSLRIADFSNCPPDHLFTAVFAQAEICNIPGRGPANYIFSQTIGRLVSERFDGMQIPGVRGAPGAHYNNVVLFHHLDDWGTWTSVTNPPYRLSV